MASSEFNSTLKSCICKMYQDGQMVKADSIQGYALSEAAQLILLQLVELVMNTAYFKEDTKKFLINKYAGLRSYAMGNASGENPYTVMSRIRYDLSKLKSALGEDSLTVIVKQSGADLSIYENKIAALLKKYRDKSLLEAFWIKTPDCMKVSETVSDDDFNTLRLLVQYGSKRGKALMESKLTPELIGYIRYLENNSSHLNEVETDRLSALSFWLKS